MADHGVFHWNELLTGDVEQAKAFFEQVCGWAYEDVPFEDFTYTVAKSGDTLAGFITDKAQTGAPEMPDRWMAYIAVDDVDAAAAQAATAGGTVVHEGIDFPDVGRIAIVQDPGGAVIGLVTPA